MPHSTVLSTVFSLLLASPGLAQERPSSDRIHGYLQRQLERVAVSEKLPVYIVVAERLGHGDWFPRVNRLSIEERRALVVDELKQHAARTQAELLGRLERHRAEGRVSGVRSNWLGNFVRCRATAAALRDVARADGIEEIRYDASWPRQEVEDALPAASPLAEPGDGPVNTRAPAVWELGFTGTGVVIMNADSGINVRHGDLVNRLWTNAGEIPGNGLDDDQNGYVDDVHGWNFFENSHVIEDDGKHGTNTAGTLVGDGSCSGTLTGQAPGALVMTAALGPPTPQTGPFTPAGEVAQWEAIQYAIQMGAHVQTSSYSYKNGFVPPPNYKMHREIGDNSLAAGLIRTNSTGNNGSLAGNPTSLNRIPFNVSTPGNLPSPYLDPAQTLVGLKGGVIGVGAHDVTNNRLLSYSPLGPVAWHLDDVLAVNPSYPLASWSAAHDDYPWSAGASLGLIQPDVTGPTGTLTTTGGGSTCALFAQTGTSNATPRVAGTLALWKGANMSLKPEDIAMIVHQTATESGGVPGKENDWGAGRVDALAGLELALCTHRVNGEPAWSVEHRVGTVGTWEVDTVPNSITILAVGTERIATSTWGGVIGIGGHIVTGYVGSSGAQGEVAVTVPVPVSAMGRVFYSQWFTGDRFGVTGGLLSSNVVETSFVP